MNEEQNIDRLTRIFHPHQMKKRDDAKKDGLRFIHYTSPDAAMKMIMNEEVWMRKSTTMNDFSEIEHGLACLDNVWNTGQHERFRSVLQNCFPGLPEEIEAEFRTWRPHLQVQTYLTCISEHLGGDEDKYGRLSMWRAYGGIGVVLNPAAFMATTDALATFSSPVRYQGVDDFAAAFNHIVDHMEHESDFIAARERQVVKWLGFMMLRYAVLCTKHPAFIEEREWRIFHTPTYQASEKVIKSIETIRGIPQPVCKIPLKNDAQVGLNNLEVSELVERIIIGPTPDPWVQAEAFVMALESKGVPNAHERVYVTNIPLRQ